MASINVTVNGSTSVVSASSSPSLLFGGARGRPAPEMIVQYSANGTAWYADPPVGAQYIRFSTDQGETSSGAIGPLILGYVAKVDGPTVTYVDGEAVFEIVDYDAFAAYSVSADAGSVSENLPFFTYAAPSAAQTATITITVDGIERAITLPVENAIVIKPSIVSPADGDIEVQDGLILTSSAFRSGPLGYYSHTATDWIIRDIAGTAIWSSLDDASNLETITVPYGTLVESTRYTAEVTHKSGATASETSDPVSFTTNDVFYPSSEMAELLASDGVSADEFGGSVAMNADGTVAIVGAIGDDSRRGSAYVFQYSGGSWSQTAKLTASNRVADDRFGSSVAINAAGDVAVVGAYGETVSGILYSGACYVFSETSGIWSQRQKLTASDAAFNDRFGADVAINGDATVIAIGTISGDACYVFSGSIGSYSEEAILVGDDLTGNDLFGMRVAISTDGGIIVAGASNHKNGIGAAYVFIKPYSTWLQAAKLEDEAGVVGDKFGFDVDVADGGNLISVGSYMTHGAVFGSFSNFVRDGNNWNRASGLTTLDSTISSLSLSSDGSTLIAGQSAASLSTGQANVFS